jgi:hypothetical protein
MEEENLKLKNLRLLFEFLITEDNEQGRLICSSCDKDITDNKEYHRCITSEPEDIYF